MIKSLEWDPALPALLLIVIAAALLAVLLTIEWRRRQRFRAARIVSQVIIVVCLLGMVLRPSIGTTSKAKPLVILTPGYIPATVDSLATAMPNLSIMRTADAESYSNATVIGYRDLPSVAGDSIWVVGSGLPSYSLSEIAFAFNFIPNAVIDGITEINLPSRIISGVPTSIHGTYQSKSASLKKLKILGPGGVEDSVVVSDKGQTPFDLKFTAAVPGTLMYTVDEFDSIGSLITSSPLPVFAERQNRADVLIISDYPNFEMRYLKNFLADKGFRVSMRNRVSQNRFHQEFANRPAYNLNLLTRRILDATDLVIIDQASYSILSSTEKNQISSSLETGLGVLFIPAKATPKSHPLIALGQIQGKTDTVRVKLQGAVYNLPSLPLKPVGEVTSITQTDRGVVTAGCRCTGELRVGFQLLRETYQLGLQGKQAAYAEIWTPLFEKVARDRSAESKITIHQFPVVTDEPTDISIVSSRSSAIATYDNTNVPLLEDLYIDGLWHAKVWAGGHKWHTVQSDSTVIHFFDLPASDWKTLRLAEQLRANANHTGGAVRETSSQPRQSLSAVFFVIFLLASGFLWLAPKI